MLGTICDCSTRHDRREDAEAVMPKARRTLLLGLLAVVMGAFACYALLAVVMNAHFAAEPNRTAHIRAVFVWAALAICSLIAAAVVAVRAWRDAKSKGVEPRIT